MLSLSDALDLACPNLNQHQLRTAYIAWQLSEFSDLESQDRIDLMFASVIHDIGALSPEDKMDIMNVETNKELHCILGEKLLSKVSFAQRASKIIRYHHTNYCELKERIDPSTAKITQILTLADMIERRTDRQKYILHQDKEIIEYVKMIPADIINRETKELFSQISFREDFWLDLSSSRIISNLLANAPGKQIELSMNYIKEISVLFRDIIDFRSRFTATHSCGVSTSAAMLTKLFGFSDFEVELMEVAGNFHDLGKMAIKNSILEKPGKLTYEEYALIRQHTYHTYKILETIGGIRMIAEWAAFHHEHLDGTGYPFHVGAKELSLRSRIMAVADIFTALAEKRPYREPMNRTDVMKIINEQADRNWLDRSVVDLLQKNYDEIEGYTQRAQQLAYEMYENDISSQVHA
jgi:HD-GYP domain-containing protein (c-di-GMP phosphodiesterase class II)